MAETVSLNTEDNTNKPKIDVSSIMQGVSGGAGALATAYSTYGNLAKEEDLTSRINSMYDPAFRGQEDFDSLESAYMNFSPYSHLTLQDVGFNKGQGAMNIASASMQGAGAGAAFGPWGALAGGLAGLAGGLFGFGAAQRKAKKLRNQANSQIDEVNAFNARSLNNRLTNAQLGQFNTLKLNDVYALGGPLHSHGADWSDGLITIDNGGSHEQNPNGGVQQGIAPDGQPNLVEEGEVIWNNDYVFSKRLKVPKAVRNKYKLRGNKPLSFADAALQLNKEMEERPNDPISKRGRNSMLAKLADVQEEKRANIALKEQQDNMLQGIQPMIAANGGAIHIDKNKRGTFTAAASRHGKSVQEFASQVLANPENYSPAMRKKANFARNAAKWHSNGGHLFPLGGEYLNWLKGLTSNDYTALINNIGGKALNYRNNPEGLFNFANLGKPGPVYEGLQNAYMYSNPPGLNGPLHPEIERGINIPEPLTIPTSRLSKLENIGEGMYTVPDANGNISFVLNSQNKKESSTSPSKNKSNSSWLTGLRYAPVVGSALGVFGDLLGITNKPDYSGADAILEASKGVRDVSFRPIGDYMAYNPFDRMFYLNQLNANAGASRRALTNQSAGNRGTAMAGILASDNNMMNSIGQMARQAEEYNLAQRQKVADFNRATNMFNSEGFLKEQQDNQGASEVRMRAAQAAAAMRDAIDQRVGAARSANLTNLFNNLGDIGWEEFNRNMVNSSPYLYYLMGRDGILGYKSRSKGGYITIKNKRRK